VHVHVCCVLLGDSAESNMKDEGREEKRREEKKKREGEEK
jgi:hypothetical protein